VGIFFSFSGVSKEKGKHFQTGILLLHVLTPNNDEMVFPDGSELGLFSFHEYTFLLLFYGFYVLFLMFNFGLLLNPTYLVDVLIGDRLEKSVLSLMGLMRTDPPFLRRENKVVKEKKVRARNQKTTEIKSGDDFKKQKK